MATFSSNDVYAYINAGGFLSHIDGTDLADRGVWIIGNVYAALDVAGYSNALYLALQPNTGAAPTSIKDDNWSVLTKIGAIVPGSVLYSVTVDGLATPL